MSTPLPTMVLSGRRRSGSNVQQRDAAYQVLLQQHSMTTMTMMDRLSDDVLLHILSFVPSCQDLGRMALTCIRAYTLLYRSSCTATVTKHLFQQLWRKQFGTMGGRTSYQSLYNAKQFLLSFPYLSPFPSGRCADVVGSKNHNSNNNNIVRTVGILTPAQENQALLYDNDDESSTCMGYFGMELLWDDGPIAIWGDFEGIRIFPRGIVDVGVRAEQKSSSNSRRSKKRKRSVTSIGQNESHVLTVLSIPEKKLFFLAFSSGKVISIQAIMVSNGNYTFEEVSSARQHNNEVTSLCVLPDGGLFSACVNGTVFKYPSATTDGSLDNAVQICQSEYAIMTMSIVKHGGRNHLLTGVQGGHVTLYVEVEDNVWRHVRGRVEGDGVPTQSLFWFDGVDLNAIVGYNNGCIICWRLKNKLQGLEMMGEIDLKLQKRPIECFRLVGNQLWVGSGCVAAAVALLKSTPQSPSQFVHLSSLSCHPKGERHASVVSCFLDHARQSCVTLCRDGILLEWSYKPERKHDTVLKWLKRKECPFKEEVSYRKTKPRKQSSVPVSASSKSSRKLKTKVQENGTVMWSCLRCTSLNEIDASLCKTCELPRSSRRRQQVSFYKP